MPSPLLWVLYNQPVLPPDHPEYEAERDVLDTVAECVGVLTSAGWQVRTVGIAHDPQPLLAAWQQEPPDAVLNLHEGVPQSPATEIAATALLEWLGLAYSGCSSACLALGRDKVRSKYLLQGAGLPTPRFEIVEAGASPAWTGPWPAIVKPAGQDASVGISQASVVSDAAALAAQVAAVHRQFGGPAIVEELLDGREFHVNVIETGPAARRELIVLPPGEIAFAPPQDGWWPIYTYTAKWDIQSTEYQRCPVRTRVELPPPLAAELVELARRAFRLFGCRDYARIDCRLDRHGRPHVLEMNPNPYLISIILVEGLEAIGRSFEWLVQELAWAALERNPRWTAWAAACRESPQGACLQPPATPDGPSTPQ